jgi:uncharacterized protein (DUF1015 family)
LADFRPFRGLRYRPGLAGEPGALLAPPYDVIDPAQQAALHAASPYNVIRIELAEDMPEADRYARAAETLASWRREGVVALDEAPAYYVSIQEFELEGKRRRRTHLLGRLRLEPWDAGIVRPHEETMRAPKEDRLRLLRHVRANVSPIFLAYRSEHRGPRFAAPFADQRLLDATTPDGQRHALFAITGGVDEIAASFRELPLYVLDGHHRYETALAYRDERRAAAASWSGEEPENFVLAALSASDDPGLALLPTHRLVRPPSLPADLPRRLERFFHVEDATPKSYDGTALLRLLARLTAAGASGTAFGALGLEEGRLHLLTLRDAPAARALMPAHSRTWQELDVNVLEYALLRETLGIGGDAPGQIDYTDDASEALQAVEAGRWPLAFLLNATRIEQMIAVADAGERMPAKSTFFWPKLPTGLVLNAFD